MEQLKEFKFDAGIHTTTTDDALTNTTEHIYNRVNQEWGHYLQPTQANAEIFHKLPKIYELWQLLLEGPDKNPTKEVIFQSHMRTNKQQEHEIGAQSDTLEAQTWMAQTVQKLHSRDYNQKTAQNLLLDNRATSQSHRQLNLPDTQR